MYYCNSYGGTLTPFGRNHLGSKAALLRDLTLPVALKECDLDKADNAIRPRYYLQSLLLIAPVMNKIRAFVETIVIYEVVTERLVPRGPVLTSIVLHFVSQPICVFM